MIQSIVLKKGLDIQEFEPEHIISTAIKCLENYLRYDAQPQFTQSETVSNFLRLHLGAETEEVFAALFLNNQNQLISFEKLFYGTVNEANVHPRKIVKKCLEHNAAKIIVAHNHPSQNCKPSNADQEITKTLFNILKVIDVQLVDHFVVSPHETYSFVEHCLI